MTHLTTPSALASDVNSLAGLRARANADPKSAVREVARQFEALFMHELMKSMRAATLSSGMLDNEGSKLGTELLDQQFATQMTGLPGGLCLPDRPGRARKRLGPARDPPRRRHAVAQPVRHQGRRRLEGRGGRGHHHRSRERPARQGPGQATPRCAAAGRDLSDSNERIGTVLAGHEGHDGQVCRAGHHRPQHLQCQRGRLLAPAGHTEALQQVRELLVSAGNGSDTDAERANLGARIRPFGNLQLQRSMAGESLNRIDAVEGRLADTQLDAQTERSLAEDLDMVKALSDFQARHSGYEAALSTCWLVQRLSLFQYLKWPPRGAGGPLT